jgi:uncharacterized protein (DUF302 family)
MTNDGLITAKSNYSVAETIDRLASAVRAVGLSVFARVDHAQNAQAAGMSLRPTELLIFGNPKGGTPLMQDRQTSGIDLPVKALAWQDADGSVWLTYNDIEWIAGRHQLAAKSDSTIGAIAAGMRKLASEATS